MIIRGTDPMCDARTKPKTTACYFPPEQCLAINWLLTISDDNYDKHCSYYAREIKGTAVLRTELATVYLSYPLAELHSLARIKII